MYKFDIEAKKIGATHSRIFYTEGRNKYDWSKIKVPFSKHYFNSNDDELCYFIYDIDLFGMTVFEKPRVWSDFFKTHPAYGEPFDLSKIM